MTERERRYAAQVGSAWLEAKTLIEGKLGRELLEKHEREVMAEAVARAIRVFGDLRRSGKLMP